MSQSSTKILPPAVIGIIGASANAKQFAMTAIEMGYTVYTYDPSYSSPAADISHKHVIGSYHDINALKNFAAQCSVVTFLSPVLEGPEAASLEMDNLLPQRGEAMNMASNHYRQQAYVREMGIPVPESVYIENVDKLHALADTYPYPVILKPAKPGSPKAIVIVQDQKAMKKIEIDEPYLVQTQITVENMIAVTGVASDNKITFYPPAEVEYSQHRLKYSLMPGDINKKIVEKANDLAGRIMKSLSFTGVFTMQFFISGGDLIFHKVAPYPSLISAMTIHGANQSHVFLHLKALCNLPFGEIKIAKQTLLIPIRQENLAQALKFYSEHAAQAYLTLYRNKAAGDKTQVGYLTLIADSKSAAVKLANAYWNPPAESATKKKRGSFL
ncbi:MAG: ATP-grasp domain-containing protein [Erysipelotrichaceae bacterium]|jgi:5-(carboxyamino)imidazole ribonucleotide synthase|nr:ATP-grasp domain-containing protein [Erysipelotrichaceae bacterium]